VRYLLTAHRRRLEPPWEAAFDGVGGRIWRLPGALPLFFVPEQVRSVAAPEVVRALTARNPDFARLAVHAGPGAPAGPVRPVPQEGRVWLREVRPNGFELVTESRTGALVASSVGLVPGWRAAIDGNPVEPVKVNSAFLGLRVPPGVHRVELEYRPRGWVWGLGMFWAAVAGMALWGAVVASSPWWKSVWPRCERRGAGYKAPRRRRCRAIVEERERRRRPHAVATLWAHGGCGRLLRCSSSTMAPHRLLLAPCIHPARPMRAAARTSTTGC
jgi:hypothetical protein